MNNYQSYYTESKFITEYMVNKLNITEEDLVLEPSAGNGVFIDTILRKTQPIIDAYDINPDAISVLNKKYGLLPNIKVVHSDTLLDEELNNKALIEGYYTKIIGNPPYGAWQDYDKRDNLKKIYKGFYVKETYALFLLRSVKLLAEKGKLTFIIPDTFMNLHRFESLREYLLFNTKILDITIFPSNFFPGVNYGYSKMCIINLEKVLDYNEALDNETTIIEGLKSPLDFEKITQAEFGGFETVTLSQREIYDSKNKAFLIKGGTGIRNLINVSSVNLGDIANCVTGIYTGDNSRFFKVAHEKVRNQSKCPIITSSEINNEFLEYEDLLSGIDSDKVYIPIVKGAADNYIRNIDWYIDWSKEAIEFYNTNKKARFQNANFYFKKGIALPMVKSSKIKANLIENLVFDQSAVGVFPQDEKYLYYLLGYFNSTVFTKIIHTINPTANNSANYVKKIPVIIVEEDINEINDLVEDIISIKRVTGKVDNKLQQQLDSYFNNLYEDWLE